MVGLNGILGRSAIGIHGIDNLYPLVLILKPFMTVIATSLLWHLSRIWSRTTIGSQCKVSAGWCRKDTLWLVKLWIWPKCENHAVHYHACLKYHIAFMISERVLLNFPDSQPMQIKSELLSSPLISSADHITSPVFITVGHIYFRCCSYRRCFLSSISLWSVVVRNLHTQLKPSV